MRELQLLFDVYFCCRNISKITVTECEMYSMDHIGFSSVSFITGKKRKAVNLLHLALSSFVLLNDKFGSQALLSAAIEHVEPHDVPVGHAPPLADLDVGVGDGGDGVPAVLDGEGCFSIVHDGGVVVGSVQVVGVLLVEVVGHLRVDVLPVDPDVVVAVAPGLLVQEGQSVDDLVLYDAVVEAALLVEREDLSSSCSAQSREASLSVLNADVVVLVGTGDKADAGSAVELLHGVLDLLHIPAAEVPAHGEGDHHHAVGGFPPQAALGPARHGVSGSGSQQVSFQQHLVSGVVGGQNPGGDINTEVVLFSTSFLRDRLRLTEAEQEQQQQADRGSHLQGGSAVCGASVASCFGETP